MKKKTYEELVKESPVTYEMYANMEDDGNRYEISDGVLELLSPTPSTIHQMIRTELQFSLYRSCQDDFIIIQAPLDFILSDTEVRQPDLLMIHHSRKSIIGKWGIFGAPNLVVEITSEHTLKRDKVIKRNVYANYGSNFTLEQYSLDGDHYELVEVYAGDNTIRSQSVPCASFSMNDILRSLPIPPEMLK